MYNLIWFHVRVYMLCIWTERNFFAVLFLLKYSCCLILIPKKKTKRKKEVWTLDWLSGKREYVAMSRHTRFFNFPYFLCNPTYNINSCFNLVKSLMGSLTLILLYLFFFVNDLNLLSAQRTECWSRNVETFLLHRILWILFTGRINVNKSSDKHWCDLAPRSYQCCTASLTHSWSNTGRHIHH